MLNGHVDEISSKQCWRLQSVPLTRASGCAASNVSDAQFDIHHYFQDRVTSSSETEEEGVRNGFLLNVAQRRTFTSIKLQLVTILQPSTASYI